MRRKNLTAREVMDRLLAGEALYPRGGNTQRAAFDDGALVAHDTIRALVGQGKIDRPEHASVHSPYTLRKAGAQ